MSNLTVTTRFTKNSGQPATGLTLAQIDLYLVSINKSSGAIATVWNPQPPSAEVGGGEYLRIYTSADFETFDYRARAQYTGATVLDSVYAYSHAVDNNVSITEAQAQAIADQILRRSVANVQDEAERDNLAQVILATFESSIVGTDWVIRKTTGDTFEAKTVTLDEEALPVAGVT